MAGTGKHTRESALEKEIRLYAEARGCLFYKWLGAIRGVPDRILVTPKGTVFVETKAKGKKLTEIQELRRDEIITAGGNHVLALCLDDLAEWFDGLQEIKK